MSTREIARDQWLSFLETFTSEHAGGLVSLGMDGEQPTPELVEIEARVLPLREISADLKDKENTIVISLGQSSDQLLRHFVQSVSHVRVSQTKDGIDSAILIESVNGQTTTLNIVVPVSTSP